MIWNCFYFGGLKTRSTEDFLVPAQSIRDTILMRRPSSSSFLEQASVVKINKHEREKKSKLGCIKIQKTKEEKGKAQLSSSLSKTPTRILLLFPAFPFLPVTREV